jgi:predicted nucleic acid-binding protein
MIILDTNVVSEVMKPSCDFAVRSWLDIQAKETLFITTINLSELLLGIELLPPGKRRRGYSVVVEEFLEQVLKERILSFDEASARAYSLIMSRSRLKGLAISIADGQIAAIALVHGYAVATRDTGPFKAAGVQFINPWES